jgi:hypothetical protein
VTVAWAISSAHTGPTQRPAFANCTGSSNPADG